MRFGLTSYGAAKALDLLLNTAAWAMPTLSVGLSTTDVGWAGTLTGEPTTGGYTREALTASMGAVTLATGIAASSTLVQWDVATGSWGTLTHAFAADGATPGAGNAILRGRLTDLRNQRGKGIPIIANSLPMALEPGEVEFEIPSTANGFLTNDGRKSIGDHVLGKTSHTATDPWLCLFSSNPGLAGTLGGNELLGSGYARINLAGKIALTDTDTGIARSSAAATFAAASGNWLSVRYIGIASAAAAGTLRWFSPLRDMLVVETGDALVFPAGQLAFQLQKAA